MMFRNRAGMARTCATDQQKQPNWNLCDFPNCSSLKPSR